jgi:uncharacterized RDD family membrane protein YckC
MPLAALFSPNKCSMPIDLIHAQRPNLWRHLAALFYDSLLLAALWVLAAALVVVPLGLFFGITSNAIAHNILFRIYLFALVPALFFGGFWLRGGQTLGMRAWRIQVVRTDGQPLSMGNALRRLIAAILSWGVFGCGFFWALIDREGRTWHDRLSGTRLVMLESPRPTKHRQPSADAPEDPKRPAEAD